MNQQLSETVWQYYREHSRAMPWRDDPTFYHVLVSEIMLQQTQVERVRVKYDEFMARFPSVEKLADAKLSEVLKLWQGLGYNRRAKFLHDAAKRIAAEGQPRTFNQMVDLPGIGKNTAGALMNYVYNSPTAFVETNIRTVYFHHFFPDALEVHDRELLELVESTMDRENPREWFWALMDYGTFLKKQGYGRLSTSKHYKKQSKLEGSLRQMRGIIVKRLAEGPRTMTAFAREVNDERFTPALDGLIRDGLVARSKSELRLTD